MTVTIDTDYKTTLMKKECVMETTQSLQDIFLGTLRKEKIPVYIYLLNGIKLQGRIDSFDQYTIFLKNNINQMIYKHAVSTIVPVYPGLEPETAPAKSSPTAASH